MLRRLFLFLLGFGACFSIEGQAKGLVSERFFLDNGLEVIVLENHKAPLVQQMLFYKSGAADEAAGKGGSAHLLEHLMFRGTEKVEGQALNRLLEENGAESNAFTSQEVTAYHQLADISRLELLMFLEADRADGLFLKESDFETERQIVYQERKQRVDNNPTALFFEKIRRVLWQDHPFANPVTGTDKEIQSLSKKDVADFYKTYYAPNNAVLVLAGDIEVATARRLAQKYYGHWVKSDVQQTVFPELPKKYRAQVEMSLPDVQKCLVSRIYAVPSFKQDKKTAYALDVLSSYLAGDETSPLYQKLVLRDKLLVGLDVDYSGISRHAGTFSMTFVPVKNEVDASFLKKIDSAVAQAVKNLTSKELKKVKQKMLADQVYLEDSPQMSAQLAGYLAATGTGLDILTDYEADIQAVQEEDVRRVFELLRTQTAQVTGILCPEEKSHE